MQPSLLEAQRSQQIPFSSIRKVFEKARAMEAKGISVARMEIGRPDFDTPKHIKEAAVAAMEAGHVHYAPNKGIEELRQAITQKLLLDNAVRVDSETGIIVTVGCKEAIILALLAFLDPGDEVLIPDPCWDTYLHSTTFLGGTPVTVPLRPENHYQPDPGDFEKKITKRTKILVIVSPSNPTGAVYAQEVLEQLADIAIRHDLIVISDEIYEKLVYDGAKHTSIASLPGMAERTITINGFSKAYAMDGWRIGYAAGPERLISPMIKVHQYTTNCVTTFVQHGAVAAYTGTQEPLEEMRAEFDRRRIALTRRLSEMPGVTAVEPQGAFYVFPRFDGIGMDSAALAETILQEAMVACVPGDVFGIEGQSHVRFSYATSYDSIIAGMDRLRAALERLHGSA